MSKEIDSFNLWLGARFWDYSEMVDYLVLFLEQQGKIEVFKEFAGKKLLTQAPPLR